MIARGKEPVHDGFMAITLKSFALRLALLLFGQTIRDFKTGRKLGRALLIPFGGQIRVIGLRAAVVPEFVPSKELVYWRQTLGFTVHPPPDHDDVRNSDSSFNSSR